MENHRNSPTNRVILFLTMKAGMSAAAAIFLLAVVTSLQAQAVRIPSVDRSQEMQRRSILLDPAKNATTKPLENDPALRRQRLLTLQQVREDFTGIQVLTNEMMLTISTRKAFDYKRISDSTAEIKKRASRLKVNLALPESKISVQRQKDQEKDQDALDDAQLKALMLELDNSIMSFVKNSYFSNPGVVDTELSVKASRDLKSIIDLSGRVKKSAESLKKTSELPK